MKLTDVLGVKVFKSWGGYFDDLRSNLTNFHANSFAEDAITSKRPSMSMSDFNVNLPKYEFSTPSGNMPNAGKTLADTMSRMRSNYSK
jgi:hypothetical protein